MKSAICTAIGIAGAAAASVIGGLDAALGTLITFMATDFLTGLMVAGFGRSEKTKKGGLDSHVGWKGLAKKGVILLLVLVAHRLDLTLGSEYVRNTVIIGFTANELISITENAGLLGVPMPKGLRNAIEILKSKGGENE